MCLPICASMWHVACQGAFLVSCEVPGSMSGVRRGTCFSGLGTFKIDEAQSSRLSTHTYFSIVSSGCQIGRSA